MITTRANTPRQNMYAEGGTVLDKRFFENFKGAQVGDSSGASSGLVSMPTQGDILSGALNKLPDVYKEELNNQYQRAIQYKLAQQALAKVKEENPKLSGKALDSKANRLFVELSGNYFGKDSNPVFINPYTKLASGKGIGKGALPVTISDGKVLGNYYKYADPKKLGDIVDTGDKGTLDSMEEYSWLFGNPDNTADLLKDVSDRHVVSNKKGWASTLAKSGKLIPAVAASIMAPGIGTALAAGLGTSTAVGTALAGAGFGAVGGAASGGGLKGTLLGAGLGAAGGYVKGAGGLGKALGVDPSAVSRLPDGTWTKAVDIGNATASVEPTMFEKTLHTLGKLGGEATNPVSSKLSSLSKALNAYQMMSEGTSSVPQQSITSSSGSGATTTKSSRGRLSPLELWYRSKYGYATGGNVDSSLPYEGDFSSLSRLIKGNGDGMSDDVPAIINGTTPAALSDSEHVTPALQVALLGRGSPEAGSKKIQDLLESEIKKMYGKNINPKQMQKNAMKKDSK